MAQIFNPWADPPSTNTLTGDLASFEINDMEEPGTESSDETETEMPEPEDAMMQQALQVISQQAELINKLMATLSK
jgi:hypothetical protein